MHRDLMYRAGRCGWRVVSALAVTMLLTTAAWAHMMPAQQGTLNILDNAVFAALSLPCSALHDVDDNHDGRLSQDELRVHASEIQAQLARGMHFFDGDLAGRLDLVMPMVEPDERDSTSMAGSTHLLVLLKSTFTHAPTALRLETTLFGAAANEQQLTLKATRGADSEAAILTPRNNGHAFFRAPWQVVRDYVVIGVEHILLGTDHLLFLLTIIVAAAGWRYWLGVLTSFTVAHSITLTLALFGVVRVPAGVIEPLIAASIVLMAILNLRQREPVAAQRMAIVFACGLLHGLGFASAIGDLGLHGTYRVASIVGFNIGIELGQATFLCAVLAAGVLWRRATALPTVARLAHSRPSMLPRLTFARAASWSATVVGAFWLVERLRA
jgi:hydrogenase/urease accessory protein HupE